MSFEACVDTIGTILNEKSKSYSMLKAINHTNNSVISYQNITFGYMQLLLYIMKAYSHYGTTSLTWWNGCPQIIEEIIIEAEKEYNGACESSKTILSPVVTNLYPEDVIKYSIHYFFKPLAMLIQVKHIITTEPEAIEIHDMALNEYYWMFYKNIEAFIKCHDPYWKEKKFQKVRASKESTINFSYIVNEITKDALRTNFVFNSTPPQKERTALEAMITISNYFPPDQAQQAKAYMILSYRYSTLLEMGFSPYNAATILLNAYQGSRQGIPSYLTVFEKNSPNSVSFQRPINESATHVITKGQKQDMDSHQIICKMLPLLDLNGKALATNEKTKGYNLYLDFKHETSLSSIGFRVNDHRLILNPRHKVIPKVKISNLTLYFQSNLHLINLARDLEPIELYALGGTIAHLDDLEKTKREHLYEDFVTPHHAQTQKQPTTTSPTQSNKSELPDRRKTSAF